MRKSYYSGILSVFLLALLSFVPGRLCADDYYLTITDQMQNAIIVTETGEHEYTIQSMGGDPYVKIAELERDLTDEETLITFDYQLDKDISNEFEFFFCFPSQGPTGGWSQNCGGLTATSEDEWKTMTYDIASSRSSFNWGHAGDYLRFDPGNTQGITIKIRNLRIRAINYDYTTVNQIGTAEDLKAFMDRVNDGETRIKGVLTNDIDFTAYDESMTEFQGELDGQGHSITVNYNRTEDNAALIAKMTGSAVVQNLIVKGEITTDHKYAAGIAAHTYSKSVVRNCVSLVNIHSSIVGDGTHGGLVGVNESGLTMKNCVFAGSMDGDVTNSCGGLIGWSTGSSVVDKCIIIADFSVGVESAYTVSRNPSNVTATDVYYVNALGEVNSGATQVTTDVLASGEICYLLNGTQEEISWYQTLGEDAYPVPFSSHAQVYAVGELRCDGTSAGGSLTYSNSQTSTIPAHQFESGICKVCGAIDSSYKSADEDGYYTLNTGNDLVWFSALVDGGNTTANARLTANVDLTDIDFKPIGNADNIYTGTFDGQGHTISNLTVNQPETNGVGMFGFVSSPATIQNFVLDQTCSINGKGYVGIIGESATGRGGKIYMTNLGNEGTVTCTGANAGGIIGCCMGSSATFIMTNCYVTGTISGGNESAALSGWFGNDSQAYNCWSTAEVTGIESEATYLGRGSWGKNNIYSTRGTQVTTVSAESVVSGELCYTMNGGSMTSPIWYQNVGEDQHPVLDSTHGVVYRLNDGVYGDIHDDATFQAYRTNVFTADREYLSEVIATQELIDNYSDALDAMNDVTDRDEFIATYSALSSLMDELKASAAAYQAYQDEITSLQNTLESDQSFAGPARTNLEEYVESSIEPGDQFANGSASYIIENHVLTTEEIKAETEYAASLLTKAIAEGYTKDGDITNLLTNADFSDGFNGWEGKVANGTGTIGTMNAAEAWNTTFDMHQTLTGLSNGIYELQVNGGFRPCADYKSTNYAAMIYANDCKTYLMADIEGMIAVADAVDGENCYITEGASTTDLEIYDENEEELLGYIMHGTKSCCYAFQAGRYPNRILCNVTDGTLTVGIKSDGTGNSYDWTGFGNIHLIYRGELSEADEALNNTLAGDVDRAKTLIAEDFYDDESYSKRPNFNQEIRDNLATAIAAVETAGSTEEKYALVERFSSLFQEAYDCKQAYIQLIAKMESVYGAWSAETEITQEFRDNLENLNNNVWTGYVEGSLTLDEARALIEQISNDFPVYIQLSSSIALNSITLTDLGGYSYQVDCQGSDPYIGVSALDANLTDEQNYITFEYKADHAVSGEFFYAFPTQGFTGGIEKAYDTLPVAEEWTRTYIDISEARKEFGWGSRGDYLRWDPIPDGYCTYWIRHIEIVDYATLQQLMDGVQSIQSDKSADNTNVYDISGRLVRQGNNLKNLPAGVYVSGGRKVFVK